MWFCNPEGNADSGAGWWNSSDGAVGAKRERLIQICQAQIPKVAVAFNWPCSDCAPQSNAATEGCAFCSRGSNPLSVLLQAVVWVSLTQKRHLENVSDAEGWALHGSQGASGYRLSHTCPEKLWKSRFGPCAVFQQSIMPGEHGPVVYGTLELWKLQANSTY